MALEDLNHNLAFNNFVERVIGETNLVNVAAFVKMSDSFKNLIN